MPPISGKTLIGLGIFVLFTALSTTVWTCHTYNAHRFTTLAFLEIVCPAGRLDPYPEIPLHTGPFSKLATVWVLGSATLVAGMFFCWLESLSRATAQIQDFGRKNASSETASFPPPHYPDPRAAPSWAEDFSFLSINGSLYEARWGLSLLTSSGPLDDFFPQIHIWHAPEWAAGTPGAPVSNADLVAWKERMRMWKRPESIHSLNISGRAVCLHSALRFDIPQRLNDPTWLFSSLEKAMPALGDRAPALVIAAIQALARHENTWINMLGAMPGRPTVPIDRLEITMPAALATCFPSDILADLVQMADGPYLVAQAPL
ncbi:MAG TPA: hypothetical protein VN047_19360 [Sphingopyxis sp.]|uniref:hypothetical protein n=1 Tax=Sphingopyxis sp. TaxID=1908224 RepID=UPI002B643743|nr:hypothetical protein [Sphingopyxis sp.]HWW59062.1 hypothetical protein [Sphingopyxis sp.]